MEHFDRGVSRLSKKRKVQEDELGYSMDELNEDLLEKVLSWLPTSTFFRLSSVCKRWKSVAASKSFKLACSHIPSRDPWFFMVDPHLNQSIIFDSAEKNWKKLNHPSTLHHYQSMPVAASGGLVCYRTITGNFLVSNPVTQACRQLPSPSPTLQDQPLQAIAMNITSNYHGSYKLVLVSGELPRLSFKVYDSSANCWEEEVLLSRKVNDSLEFDSNSDDAVYFLSKAGNVVATNLQRSPSKQYSAVITVKDDEETVYFLSSSGTIVACNVTCRYFCEYPRLLPAFSEYSIDVVECRGEMLVVLLSEFFESSSVRVWRFDEKIKCWQQIAAMPPAMSHELFGKKVDINCVGAGDRIFMCLNSAELFRYIVCDLVSNEWIELPNCFMNGEAIEFMSAFSFEPRIEASV
ncbi:F-box only protein 13 [Carica papaya]|uniref:F-box only protein 13 n=1 Tax=Carica papaya TaxID=3649 RepID=UPI000B8CF017|nr:F-box only protein 13 [Carica papaya]XP_021894423.1 F-box only protein 13 [Carica papaya]